MALVTANLDRLRSFVESFTQLVRGPRTESDNLRAGSALLAELIAHDDWLPEPYAQPDAHRYCQYLLHCDSLERFCVVSFVWGPSQATPVHDHTVWGLVGVLRGAERIQRYARHPDGPLKKAGPPYTLGAGEVDAIDPLGGDIHQVRNAHDDRVSLSIHVYGGNIGAIHRNIYGKGRHIKPFVSGYTDAPLPNLGLTSG